MNDNPTLISLGNILKIKHGWPFLGEYFSDTGEFILITPGNFFESGGFKQTLGKEKYYVGKFPIEYLCNKGDLIVAMTQQAEGLLGSTAIIPSDGVYLHNQRIGLISNDESLSDMLFIYYLFMLPSVRKQIRATASGSKVKHTSPERIYDVKVLLPELSQQKSISKILNAIDKKIALNNAINIELENMAKLLYDYWFVQFDFPDENGKPYRSSGGEMVYNELLKRVIPKGWEVDQVGNVLKNIESGRRDTGGAVKNGIPSIGAENIEALGVYNFNKEKYISHDFYVKMDKGKVKSGDVLLYKDGAYSGKVSMALDDFPHKECAVNEHVFILRTIGKVSNYFLYLTMKRPEVYARFNRIASSKAAQPGLNQEQLKSEIILIPHHQIALKFNKIVESIMKKVASGANQNKELTALRDFLLPLLMNGQVTVTRS